MFHVNQSIIDKLKIYEQLLYKWQKSVNLVSPATLDDAWARHFEDSLQLAQFLGGVKTLADIGSGAGFPGLVLAAALPETDVHLIESDGKKAAFLASVSREMGLKNAHIHHNRVEKILPALRAEVVSARALASLNSLIEMTRAQWERTQAPAWLLFPKGADFAAEIKEAEKAFHFNVNVHPSRTDSQARILCISDVAARGVA